MHLKEEKSRHRKCMCRCMLITVGILNCYLVIFLWITDSYQGKLENHHNNLNFLREDNYNNETKIEIMEGLIKSSNNQEECVLPDLPIDNPEIMQFFHNTPPLNCGNKDDDWVICEKSLCIVKPNIVAVKGVVTCSYTDIIRMTEYKVKHGQTTSTNNSYVLQKSDFAKVSCNAENGDRWTGIVIGVRDSVKRQNKNIRPMLNVVMLGIHSLSRNAFIRKLPNTYNYLTKNLNGIVLKGYNIIGDGTPQALIPILTGHTMLELPDTRKRIEYSDYVNVYPMIWKDYEENGYITSFNEDLKFGAFTYSLNGFDDQPTDHYMRTVYLEAGSYASLYSKFCFGHQPGHQVMLNYIKNILLKYGKNPIFAFSFLGDLSHGSINSIGVADDDIKNWLEDLRSKGVLENTILILMSDHGNRFHEMRNTLQGKQEERLPFFSFTFPTWFQKQFPKEHMNFVENANRLTTPFDVHETLLDIIRIQSINRSLPSQQQKLDRAISLFEPIPELRSCADAHIEPHWCACLSRVQINDTSSVILNLVANSIVDKINQFTKQNRDICEKVALKKINWALKLIPKEELVKFKKTFDVDGLLGDFTSETKIDIETYRVKLTIMPENTDLEGRVLRNLKTNRFDVLYEIFRVYNKERQEDCVYGYPELKKYCFCKTEF